MKIGGETRAGIDPSSVNYGHGSMYELMREDGTHCLTQDVCDDSPDAEFYSDSLFDGVCGSRPRADRFQWCEVVPAYNFFDDDVEIVARNDRHEGPAIWNAEDEHLADNSALKFLEDVGKVMIITLELAIMASFSAAGCVALVISPVLSEGVLEEGARRAAGIPPEIV